MSPLEAMKRLQAADPFVMNERAGTSFCFACGSYDKHASDCPVLSLPQIVAALEAAQALKGAVKHQRFNQPNDWLIERLAALQEALKG